MPKIRNSAFISKAEKRITWQENFFNKLRIANKPEGEKRNNMTIITLIFFTDFLHLYHLVM